MKALRFKGLLQRDGWVNNPLIELDDDGIIKSITADSNNSAAEFIDGLVLPAFQNAHSHAFQYAMVGLAEKFTQGTNDDFWAWRETMYKIALTMDPEDLENIAAMLYSEMVRHGYSEVAEFHYVHHDKNGKPYGHLAELGERLVSAAQRAGIKITLVPMFYQKGGFGMEPQERQRRFISNTIDDYQKLLEASRSVTDKYAHASLGIGIHSLRAVQPEDVIKTLNQRPESMPFHIHVSEQLQEISGAEEYLGARPVQWLLDNSDVNENYHLVHATHLDDKEVNGVAASGANVVLCPTTEGNLGDGIFRLKDYQKRGGKWSVGTDSHISLNPLEELRLLDYGQRLISHERSTFLGNANQDSSMYALEQFIMNGRRAMGKSSENFFEVGKPFDAVVYNAKNPLLAATADDNMLATLIYSTDSSHVLDTYVDGKSYSHQPDREAIYSNFIATLKKLDIR